MTRVPRRGMTLVEMLVAMTISLVLIYGMVLAFGQVGQEASDGRAKIEMANQMRSVMRRLELDLNGLTVPMRNWAPSGSASGYFQYIEGPEADRSQTNIFGDIDDVVMFTTRNDAEPFVGRFNNNPIESPVAEVIWAVRKDPSVPAADNLPRNFYLFRKALLVIPGLNNQFGYIPGQEFRDTPANLESEAINFLSNNDVSVRFSVFSDSGGALVMRIVANSLDTLAVRENRFAHRPIPWAGGPLGGALIDSQLNVAFPHRRYQPHFDVMYTNNNVMMSHVLSFDIQAYDPQAPLYYDDGTSGNVLAPADHGYTSVTSNTLAGRGAFVDLQYIAPASTLSLFSGGPSGRSQLAPERVYDTWTSYYETNGLNEADYLANPADGSTFVLVDEGADGVDSNLTLGVDDAAERETAPPYAAPLRGLKATLRMYESDTRQVRQSSLVSDFIPE